MSVPTPVLSEKAKGKRKAIQQDDPSTGSSQSQPATTPRSFTVRFSEGLVDLSLSVLPDDTVREVLRKVHRESLIHITSTKCLLADSVD